MRGESETLVVRQALSLSYTQSHSVWSHCEIMKYLKLKLMDQVCAHPTPTNVFVSGIFSFNHMPLGFLPPHNYCSLSLLTLFPVGRLCQVESIKTAHLGKKCLSVRVDAYGFITALCASLCNCVNALYLQMYMCLNVNVHVCVCLWVCKCVEASAPLRPGSMAQQRCILLLRKHLQWDRDSCGQPIPLHGP